MKFFTSRYTASLEEKVAELKKQLEHEQQSAINQLEHERQQANLSDERSVKQISDLKSDLIFERDQVSRLTVKLVESVQSLADANAKAPTADKDKKELPRAGNWLRQRAALESTDHIVREAEPDKEKSANGSR